MKPISINLASRPFYNTRLYLVAFSASVVLLLIMTFLNVVTMFQGQAAWKRFNEDQAGLQSELRSLDHDVLSLQRDLQRRDLTEVSAQSKFANLAIVQRMFSWTLMFNRLEQILPPTVKLRALRPKVDENGIHFRVLGTAKNASAFADFEEALIAAPLFSEVYPESEGVAASGKGVDFSLSFRYLASTGSEVGGAAVEQAPEEHADELPAGAATTTVDSDSGAEAEDALQEASS